MTRKPHSLTAADLERVAELRLALRRFHAATDRVTAAHGLTPRQYDLLAVLHAPSRGGAVASTLARELAISTNAMTELVSRAVRAGLIDRHADRSDARRKPLAPTTEGRQRYEAAAVELRPERDQLLTALSRALREVEEASRGGEP